MRAFPDRPPRAAIGTKARARLVPSPKLHAVRATQRRLRGESSRPRALAALLGATVAFSAAEARADAGSPAFTRYEVVNDCPAKPEADARLAAHLAGASSLDAASVSLVVLETTDSAGLRSMRAFADPSCREVVWSLVFVAALAISPDAKILPPPEAPTPPPEAPPSPAPSVTVPSAPKPPRQPLALEAGPQLRVGPMPALAYGAEVRGSLGMVAVAAGFATSGEEAVPGATGATAQLWLVTARPQACPFAIGSAVRGELCAGLDVGVLHASSRGLAATRSVSALWLAAEPLLRVRFELASPVFLSAEARVGIPLHRPTYTIGPAAAELHRVPVVVGGASIFAGVSWK